MNEKTITVNFTAEQISLHVGALISHKRRHERSLIHDEERMRDAMAAGDVEYANKMKASKKRRSDLIAAVVEEIDYFKDIYCHFEEEMQ